MGLLGLTLASGRSEVGEPVEVDVPGMPRLVHLEPGLAVAGAIPEGWTHRVIRSMPRLTSGALATLPESARASATLFRTVILVEMTQSGRDHAIGRLGVGNAVPFRGREGIVTADGPAEVRESLSTIERLIANAADAELAKGRIVARSPTFALFRTPAKLVLDAVHREVDLYYAILADPETGRVQTLTWATPAGETACPRRAIALEPDTIFDCTIDVAVRGRVGPISVSWSFAMTDLPAGRPVAIPSDLALTIGEVAAGRAEPASLEPTLRRLVESPDTR